MIFSSLKEEGSSETGGRSSIGEAGFSDAFPLYENDGCPENFPKVRSQISSENFHETFHAVLPVCSHDFSLWETLTSNIESYKKSCGALRPPSRKEVGTTVLALNGVDVTSQRGTSIRLHEVFKLMNSIPDLSVSFSQSIRTLIIRL